MNTEKMIPIDFPRNITPYVPGDVYYNNFVDAEFTMDQRDADEFNNADPKGEFNTYFIVSFANRPNTTGKQPVADDVIVDAYYESEWNEHPAGFLDWACNGELSAYLISKWKPNHAALLAKFKEQGANTMTKLAEQKRLDHAVALTIESLEDNPDGQVLNEDWLIDHLTERKESPCTGVEAPKEINFQTLNELSHENLLGFAVDMLAQTKYQNDEIEKLSDLINPVSEGCQAGDEQLKTGVEIGCCTNPKDFGVNADTYHKLPHAINAIPDKPVFTQEMADAGDRPKAMMECLVFNTLLDSPKYEKAVIDFIGEWCCVYTSESCRERSASVDDLLFKPIDNRSDGQKIREKLAGLVSGYVSAGEECDIQHYVDELMQSFSITLNK